MTERETKWPSKFEIGRVDGMKLTHAFTIERREDGGVKLTDIDPSVSDAERQAILATFGAAQTAPMGHYPDENILGTAMHTEEPGSAKHFAMAIYQLPKQFRPMRVEG